MLGNRTFPLNQYPSVRLDTYEIALGISQAEEQDQESARFGRGDKRGLTTRQAEMSLKGSLAEVAAHVYLNRPFQKSINKSQSPDLITSKGQAFDVKCSQGVYVHFVAQEHLQKAKGNNCHFMFLHTPDKETFYILGYLRNSEVEQFPLTNPGGRMNEDGSEALAYTIPVTALRPIPQPNGRN